MEQFNKSNIRHSIIHNYARWCAFSATRSGSPLKSKADVYPLIDIPEYDLVLKGTSVISKKEFDAWHEQSIIKINETQPKICIGWASKLVNVYLKTLTYIGAIGREGLVQHIHPPIDGGLWLGIKEQYSGNDLILNKTHSITNIKDIKTYKQYQLILEGLELIAKENQCLLIEVEKFWKGTEFNPKKS